MSDKRSVWELLLKDSVQGKLNPLNGAADKLSSKFTGLQDNINKTGIAMQGLSSQIPLLNMLTSPGMLAGAGIAAIGTGLYKAGGLAYDFEVEMAKINATAQLSETTFDKLGDRVLEIASDSGGNFDKIPAAYEKILSQTGKVNMSLDILETSLKGAQSGFTDIDMTAGAVARTLSIVGEKNATADEVLDTLLKAKAVGAGEFGDFAQYIPQLIAAGSNLGIAFKDTAGLFSFMTAKGQSAADSAMLMQNAFTALQKDTVIKGLEGKGIKLFNAEGERRNIKEVFIDLTKKLSGLSDRQKTNFFIDIGLNDAQAKNAFSVLTSDGEKFKTIMDEVNNSLGETDRQLEKTANRARDWGSIVDELKGWGVSLGEYLLPVVDALITGISAIARDVKSLFTSDFWSGFFNGEMPGEKANQNNLQANKVQAHRQAFELTKEKFGAKMQFGEGREENKYLDKMYAEVLNKLNGSKNEIVQNENKNPFKTTTTTTSGFDDNLKKGLDTISGGGTQVRNVIVNITKMVESINIQAATVKESGADITRQIEEIMLRAIQGSEQSLMNG